MQLPSSDHPSFLLLVACPTRQSAEPSLSPLSSSGPFCDPILSDGPKADLECSAILPAQVGLPLALAKMRLPMRDRSSEVQYLSLLHQTRPPLSVVMPLMSVQCEV